MPWQFASLKQLGQEIDDVFASHVVFNLHAQILSSEFIDDDKPLEWASASGAVKNKILAPNIIDAFSLMTINRIGTVAKTTFFVVFLRHFKAFLSPDSIHAFYFKALPAELLRLAPDHPKAIALELANQRKIVTD